MNRLCNTCNIKIDKNNYLKHRTYCKNCHNEKRRRNRNNIIIENQQHNSSGKEIITSHQQPKLKNNKKRSLIVKFSNCAKAYLMNHILLQKQEPIFLLKKSINQFSNIKAQTSDEIQSLENNENSTVVFDDMLLTEQEAVMICFSHEDDTAILI